MGKAIIGPILFVLLFSPPDPEFVGVLGVVKAMSEDGHSVALKIRGGKVQVRLPDTIKVRRFDGQPLRKMEEGSRLYVLGTRHSDVYYGGTRIINVVAIVSGDFNPPALRETDKKNNLEWISGTLSWQKGAPRLDHTQLNVRATRLITVVEVGERDNIQLKATIYVTGRIGGDKRARTITATEFVVVSKRVPAKERSVILPQGPIHQK